jgi:hypothetical protein
MAAARTNASSPPLTTLATVPVTIGSQARTPLTSVKLPPSVT